MAGVVSLKKKNLEDLCIKNNGGLCFIANDTMKVSPKLIDTVVSDGISNICSQSTEDNIDQPTNYY